MQIIIFIIFIFLILINNNSFASSNSNNVKKERENSFSFEELDQLKKKSTELLKTKKTVIREQNKSSLRRNKKRLRLRAVSARIGVRGLLDIGELEKGKVSINYEALSWVETQELSETESIEFLNQ